MPWVMVGLLWRVRAAPGKITADAHRRRAAGPGAHPGPAPVARALDPPLCQRAAQERVARAGRRPPVQLHVDSHAPHRALLQAAPPGRPYRGQADGGADLLRDPGLAGPAAARRARALPRAGRAPGVPEPGEEPRLVRLLHRLDGPRRGGPGLRRVRSEEHTSELQSL